MILLENPLPIYAVGAVLATVCGLAFLARRSLSALLVFVFVVLTTLLLVLVERFVVTERERVEAAAIEIMAAIEANDLEGVLARIAPTAEEVRSDARTMMPQMTVEDTNLTSLRVEIAAGEPPLATSFFRGKVDGIHRGSGQRVFYFEDVELSWQLIDDRWLLIDYRVYSDGMPIDAIDGFRMIQSR